MGRRIGERREEKKGRQEKGYGRREETKCTAGGREGREVGMEERIDVM